jgi:hypothetical protein
LNREVIAASDLDEWEFGEFAGGLLTAVGG